MRLVNLVLLAGGLQASSCVLTERLEHAVAHDQRVPPHGRQHRRFHEGGDGVEHPGSSLGQTGNGIGGLKVEGAGEDRQSIKDKPNVGLEQLVAPIERHLQRFMAGDCVALDSGEQREPVGERIGDLGRRENPEPGGSHLDCEGYTV